MKRVRHGFLLGGLLMGCSRSPGELAAQQSSDPAPSSVTREASAPTRAVAVAPPPLPGPSDAVEPWNPKQIDWQPFDDGLALAKKTNKPVCLILYTTWCQHCRNYSHVFGDPRLVMLSRSFVMIRVDADANEAIAKRYQPDGEYVPRTFLLDANGTVNPAAHSSHPRYAHFFDEEHADSLLDAMGDALAH